MTHSTQVSGPGRPMNERRDAVKEREGLDEVLGGGNALPPADDTQQQQQPVDDGSGGTPATGGKAP